ncbi:zona pellucida sperm-binding protein 4-like isoform 1-T1 [Menidia menidia]
MSYPSVRLCMTFTLLFAVMAHRYSSSSSTGRKRIPAPRTRLAMPTVTCSIRGIRAVFDPLVKDNVRVRDFSGLTVPVLTSERSCGVTIGREKNHSLSFFSRYDSCYAHFEGNKVVIPLMVQLTGETRWIRVNISCPLIKRSIEKVEKTKIPLECDVEKSLRIDCGHQGISSDACSDLGCCYSANASACFYKLNACSLDGHFVFTVKSTDTHPPIDPSNLVIKDHPHCIPEVTTPDVAVFKIGVMECGAKMTKDKDLSIYEVEVEELQTRHKGRNSPFSLEVQCEYEESDLKRVQHLRSLYTVTNPPPVTAQGTIEVQMRIATDASFTSYFTEDQLPVTLPLRKAVNVEISIVQPSPDPSLSLRVRDCFAYPASKHSVWTLLHDGCPNPMDNMRSSVTVDNQGKVITHSQVRRFDVKTFSFLDPDTGLPSQEEIYFYCWVEICTDDVDCAQHCTVISSEGDRQRRQTTSEAHRVQLVSSGQLVQSDMEMDYSSCENKNTMFQAMGFALSVGAAPTLILLLVVWSIAKRFQRTTGKQAHKAQADCEQSQ